MGTTNNVFTIVILSINAINFWITASLEVEVTFAASACLFAFYKYIFLFHTNHQSIVLSIFFKVVPSSKAHDYDRPLPPLKQNYSLTYAFVYQSKPILTSLFIHLSPSGLLVVILSTKSSSFDSTQVLSRRSPIWLRQIAINIYEFSGSVVFATIHSYSVELDL